MSSNSAFEDRRPAWFEDVLHDLERTFDALPDRPAGWDDPHEDQPAEDWEYKTTMSRSKLAIVEARWHAWTTVLTASDLATLTHSPAPATPWHGDRRSVDDLRWVDRLDPVETGAISLLAAGTLVKGEPFGLDVGYAVADERPSYAGAVPVCGCLGCDYGSENLTDELDRWVEAAVSGALDPRCKAPAWGPFEPR